jgi:hypothetical protein
MLAGGILGQGYQCGQLWGSAFAAGARAFQLFGPGPQAETMAVAATQRLMKVFLAKYKAINCQELTGIDIKVQKQALKYLARGGPIKCFSMTAGYASAAYRELNAAFSEKPCEPAPAPVSCAALLARKAGLSDLQAAMAAGLAGGIGLSGGGCGVLGAAVWIASLREANPGFALNSPTTSALTEKFLEFSDYEFDCAKITGKNFKDVYEHAEYVRGGGCAQLIEALAAQLVLP